MMKQNQRLNNGQVKRGRGRPRKQAAAREFVTLNLSEGSTVGLAGQVSCEWTRVHDGAQMRMTMPAAEAQALMDAFLGGGR